MDIHKHSESRTKETLAGRTFKLQIRILDVHKLELEVSFVTIPPPPPLQTSWVAQGMRLKGGTNCSQTTRILGLYENRTKIQFESIYCRRTLVL